MELREIMKLGKQMLLKHKLDDWTFKLNNAKRCFGTCNYKNKTIYISRIIAKLNSEDEVKDTILHEIAHILAGKQGHNHIWKEQCLKIGANPKRDCGKEIILPRGKYEAVCKKCSTIYKRFRKSKVLIVCGMCYSRSDKRNKLIYKKVKLGG